MPLPVCDDASPSTGLQVGTCNCDMIVLFKHQSIYVQAFIGEERYNCTRTENVHLLKEF